MAKKSTPKAPPVLTLKPGERFTYRTFCRYIIAAGISPEKSKEIFKELIRSGEVTDCGGCGMAKEVKYYEAALLKD